MDAPSYAKAPGARRFGLRERLLQNFVNTADFMRNKAG